MSDLSFIIKIEILKKNLQTKNSNENIFKKEKCLPSKSILFHLFK